MYEADNTASGIVAAQVALAEAETALSLNPNEMALLAARDAAAEHLRVLISPPRNTLDLLLEAAARRRLAEADTEPAETEAEAGEMAEPNAQAKGEPEMDVATEPKTEPANLTRAQTKVLAGVVGSRIGIDGIAENLIREWPAVAPDGAPLSLRAAASPADDSDDTRTLAAMLWVVAGGPELRVGWSAPPATTWADWLSAVERATRAYQGLDADARTATWMAIRRAISDQCGSLAPSRYVVTQQTAHIIHHLAAAHVLLQRPDVPDAIRDAARDDLAAVVIDHGPTLRDIADSKRTWAESLVAEETGREVADPVADHWMAKSCFAEDGGQGGHPIHGRGLHPSQIEDIRATLLAYSMRNANDSPSMFADGVEDSPACLAWLDAVFAVALRDVRGVRYLLRDVTAEKVDERSSWHVRAFCARFVGIAGPASVRIAARNLSATHPEFSDYVLAMPDDDIIAAARQAHVEEGIGWGGLRIDWRTLRTLTANTRHEPRDAELIARLHVARYTYRSADGQHIVVMYDGKHTRIRVADALWHRALNAPGRAMADLRESLCAALDFRAEGGEDDPHPLAPVVARVLSLMTPADLRTATPAEEALAEAIISPPAVIMRGVGARVETRGRAEDAPTRVYARWADAGVDIEGPATITNDGHIVLEKLAGWRALAYEWRTGDADFAGFVREIEAMKAYGPLVPELPSADIMRRRRNIDALGIADGPAHLIDCLIVTDLLRTLGGDSHVAITARHEVSQVCVMPAVGAAHSNAGKTVLAQLIARMMVPDIVAAAMPSSSAPAARTLCDPFERFGTLLISDFAEPGAEHPLHEEKRRGLIDTGEMSGPGRAMENAKPWKYRHDLVLAVKDRISTTRDMLSRSLPLYVRPPVGEERSSDEEMAAIESRAFARWLRLRAALWLAQPDVRDQLAEARPRARLIVGEPGEDGQPPLEGCRYRGLNAVSDVICAATGRDRELLDRYLIAAQEMMAVAGARAADAAAADAGDFSVADAVATASLETVRMIEMRVADCRLSADELLRVVVCPLNPEDAPRMFAGGPGKFTREGVPRTKKLLESGDLVLPDGRRLLYAWKTIGTSRRKTVLIEGGAS